MPDAGSRLRIAVHYIAAVLTMGIYGGQVCPLIDTLALEVWMAKLAVVFVLVLQLRLAAGQSFVNGADIRKQTAKQFWLELISFLGAGLLIAVVNKWAHGFSGVESGSKIILGTGILGFFMGSDMALIRERQIARELDGGGQPFTVTANFFPMTLKFGIIATIAAAAVSGIILLVVLKDLGWMMEVQTVDAESARISVIKEILFVTLIFLAHVFNLIFSYAKNLNMAIKKENTALIRVSQGHLDTRITVSSHDEFGIMAQYTNHMIAMLEKNTRAIDQTRDATIIALASLAETRDNETGDHILRTQNYVRALALELRKNPRFSPFLDDETIDLFYKSSPLHDIGKVGIPDSILLKPGKLTADEFQVMKQHTVLGKEALEKAADNLEENNFLHIAQQITCSHHEKWDGTGYPFGLKQEEIPLCARLMALADVYDALISKRVYKPAFSHEEARGIIIDGRGSHFDPDVVDAFIRIEQTFTDIGTRETDAGDPLSPPVMASGLRFHRS